jgi:hypothetical protein
MSKLCIFAIRIQVDGRAQEAADPIADLILRLREEMMYGREQKTRENIFPGLTAEILIFYREHPDAN